MTNNIQGNSHKVLSWFLNRNSTSLKEWHDIFKVMNEKTLQRLFYPARLSFTFDEEVKSFTGTQKLREFSSAKSSFKKCQRNFFKQETQEKEKIYIK